MFRRDYSNGVQGDYSNRVPLTSIYKKRFGIKPRFFQIFFTLFSFFHVHHLGSQCFRSQVQSYLIRNSRNVFTVCRSVFSFCTGISKQFLHRIRISSAPGNFDCITNCSFYFLRSCFICFCNFRIQ